MASKPKLNPKAKAFVFNASAASFTPGGASKPTPAPSQEFVKEDWEQDEPEVNAPKAESRVDPKLTERAFAVLPKKSKGGDKFEPFEVLKKKEPEMYRGEPAEKEKPVKKKVVKKKVAEKTEKKADTKNDSTEKTEPVKEPDVVKSPKPEVKSPKPEVKSPKPEVKSPEADKSPVEPDSGKKPDTSKKAESTTAPKKKAPEQKKEVKGKSKTAEKKAKSPEKKEEVVDATPKHNFAAHDTREHLNIVFIGHVDAGKSTISGQILLLTGQVDERTIAKYEKEAKDKKRDSWYIAYIMDTSEEERAKGKTVEVGRAHFTTEKRRFTLLDAPGHRTFVPNMIGGASQADVGVLVISARKGEFETGFERGGQTREHAQLAKTLGIQQLIVMVNKMDEKTVSWSKERYDEIVSKLTPFLRQWGYKPTDLTFLPVSGQTGANMKARLDPSICSWYQGPSFFDLLDTIPPVNRKENAPLRIPIMARYKESGKVHVLGKVEAGTLVKDQMLLINPTQLQVQCVGIIIDEKEAEIARCGENAEILVKGVEDESAIPIGFVLSYPSYPTKKAKMFDAQVAILDLLPHKPLITAGYGAVLHIHAVSVECQIHRLISETDAKGKQKPGRPRYLKSNATGVIRVVLEETIAIEPFDDCAQLGRFTLRDEGRTIAVGRVLTVYEPKQIAAAAADKAAAEAEATNS